VFNGRRIDFGGRFSKIVFGKPQPEAASCVQRIGLGRKRETVLPDLPTKTYEIFNVEVPDSLFAAFKGIDIEEMLETPGKLSLERDTICTVKAGASIGFLTGVVESEPVVVFTTHKEAANILASYFKTEAITGDTSAKKRNDLVEDFTSGRTDILIGTIFAMGVGLTLTRSHHVVFINRDWTPALNKQAEDRVCRIGQKNAVVVTDVLVAHPVEDVLYKVLMRKQGIIDESIEKSRHE
jgi:SNF2 family DNA or RNA helicase